MATDINPKRDRVQLESENFALNSDGKVVRRVEDESLGAKVTGIGGLLTGVEYDSVSVAYPSTTTEVYTFYQGGLAGVLQATITLTYTAASKQNLSSAVRT